MKIWSLYPNCDFDPLLGPGTIAASPRPGLVTSRGGRGCVTGIGGDGGRIQDDTPLDHETLRFQLSLKLLPDRRVLAGLCQALTKQPDRRPIRDGLRIAQEMTERDPVRCLALQFGILQPIPPLQHQQPDREDNIIVRATAFACIVRVQVRHKRVEGIPIEQTADLTLSVTQSSKSGIFVPNGKMSKFTHEK